MRKVCIFHQHSSRNHELSQQCFYCATLRQMHASENSLLVFQEQREQHFSAREFKRRRDLFNNWSTKSSKQQTEYCTCVTMGGLT
jgi:hypothetical protein